jgi:hypothetical protein
VHAAIERSVSAGDEVVENQWLLTPEPASEVNVEVAHVADDYGVRMGSISCPAQETEPRRPDPSGEDWDKPWTLDHANTLGGRERKRNVALEDVLTECGKAFLEYSNARDRLRIVGAEKRMRTGATP